MTLDERVGLWENTELTSPDGDVHTVDLCSIWSTPRTSLSTRTKFLLDLPISDIEEFVEDVSELVGWEIATGPHFGEFVLEGKIIDTGATLTGLDWQTVVVEYAEAAARE